MLDHLFLDFQHDCYTMGLGYLNHIYYFACSNNWGFEKYYLPLLFDMGLPLSQFFHMYLRITCLGRFLSHSCHFGCSYCEFKAGMQHLLELFAAIFSINLSTCVLDVLYLDDSRNLWKLEGGSNCSFHDSLRLHSCFNLRGSGDRLVEFLCLTDS